MVDETERVPKDLAVKYDSSGGHRQTDKATKCECNGDDCQLDILTKRGIESIIEVRSQFYIRSLVFSITLSNIVLTEV